MGVPPPAYEAPSGQEAYQPGQTQEAYQQGQIQQAYQHGRTQQPYQQQIHNQPQELSSPPIQHQQTQQTEFNLQDQNRGVQAQAQTPMAHPALAGGNQPYPIPLASLHSEPNWVQCPSCTQVQMTRVEFVSGTSTHLWAAALCFCFCLGCIPYCVSGLKDAEHHCGHCGMLLATYRRGKSVEVNAGAGAGARPAKK